MRTGAASRTELQWVEAYADWARDIGRGVDRAFDAYEPVYAGSEPGADIADEFTVALECAVTFQRDVGAPPTRRLERARALAIEACSQLRSWRKRLLASLKGDPSEDAFAAGGHMQRAFELLTLASDAIGRLKGDARPLPVHRRPTPESHVAPPYGVAAAAVSHHDVEVRCWSEDDWGEVVRVVSALSRDHDIDLAGIASANDERISLAPEICADLAVLAYTDRRPADDGGLTDVGNAVLTLAHEAVHVRAPGLSEAEVECAALQEVRRTARALGATKRYADRLAEIAWTDVYQENDPEYRTPACRDGGPLDANPDSRVWP